MRTTWLMIALTAILAGSAGYAAAGRHDGHGRPLSYREQLEQTGLTDENAMLLDDILQPVFGNEVRLVGVAQTNRCETMDTGCSAFGRAMTKAERAVDTSGGPRESLLVYAVDAPITQAEQAALAGRLDTAPYTLTSPASSPVQSGVQSLFGFTASAVPGSTEIRIVLFPTDY